MNSSGFDWRLVRSFLAALDQGSLLGAARQLHTSQPTVGRHISDLESQLGVTLFERTGRGLRPTAAALALTDAARQMEEAALALTQGLVQQHSDLAGSVRLSASTTVSCTLLPAILTRLHQALPQIQIELVASNTVSNLLRREADIALRLVAPQQASVIARRVGELRLGIYAHSSYLQRRGTPLSGTDLLQHDLLGFDQDDAIIKGANVFGLDLQSSSFCARTDDLIAYWELLRAGLGIGFVPHFMARTDAAVLPLLPDLRIPPLPMWLVVHRELRSSPRIRAVYDFLAEAVPLALA